MLAFHLGVRLHDLQPNNYGYGYLRLQVYPTVILQLTTLSLLMSLTSSAVAVLPAITSPVPAHELAAISQPLPKEVKSEDYQPITDPKNVERFLNDYFADIPLLAKIGKCESQYRQFNSKGEVLRGMKNTYDRGVMQINILYHQETAEKMGLDLHDIDDNVAFARYLYEKYGAKPWMSSSACWSKFASPEIAKS